MKISDILGMSLSNLWRRKMRTFLTVLGVIIGTASIVVMLSLGIGLREATMEQVESFGGLTEIMVYSDDFGSGDRLLDDNTIDSFMELDFVDGVEPILSYSMPLQAGIYEGYFEVMGVSQKYLSKIELGEGTVPEKGNTLSLIAGNQVVMDFMNTMTGEWPGLGATGEEDLDIDLLHSSVIAGVEVDEADSGDFDDDFDSSTDYYDSTFSDAGDDFSADSSDFFDDDSVDDEGANSFSDDNTDGYMDGLSGNLVDDTTSYSWFTSSTKKIPVQVTGITAGDLDTYTEYSYNVYADLDALKDFLKKYYSENSIIPGQPTDPNGKPYRDLKYSMLIVNVDEASNVESVLEAIQQMGYFAEANKEWLEQTEQQFMIIEAVLGGIGAVAMLVAAISIANTMTMSIYERTKEIGVMKVLGCSLGNIRSMFLAEAAFIGFLGGVVGIALSYLLSFLVNRLVAPNFIGEYDIETTTISLIPMWLVLAAIIFATIIGMVAGFFPAQRATKLSPLAAIRNE